MRPAILTRRHTPPSKTRGGVSVNGDTINTGEVWQFSTTQGVREILVISVFNNYAVGLMLLDRPASENNIQVRSRSMMYADAGRLTYAYYDKFTEFIRGTSDAELSDVLDAVVDHLALNRFHSGLFQDPQDAPEPPQAAPAPVEDLVPAEEARAYKREAEEAQRAIATLTVEKDIFERLYRETLERLLEKEG